MEFFFFGGGVLESPIPKKSTNVRSTLVYSLPYSTQLYSIQTIQWEFFGLFLWLLLKFETYCSECCLFLMLVLVYTFVCLKMRLWMFQFHEIFRETYSESPYGVTPRMLGHPLLKMKCLPVLLAVLSTL